MGKTSNMYILCKPVQRVSVSLLDMVTNMMFPCNADNVLVLQGGATKLEAKCIVKKVVIKTPLNKSAIIAVLPRDKTCEVGVGGCFRYYLVYNDTITVQFNVSSRQIFYCYKVNERTYCFPSIKPDIIVCYSTHSASSSPNMGLRITTCLVVNGIKIYCFTETSIGLLKTLCFMPFKDFDAIPLEQLHRFNILRTAFRQGLNNITFNIQVYLIKSVKEFKGLGRPMRIDIPNTIELLIAYPHIELTKCTT